MLFLTSRPLWVSGIIVVALTLAAMFGPVLVRRRIELARLSTNNEVAGFKFATVGVLYAVLLAFAVIVVWEKFSSAENAVATEAGAAATIYRLSSNIPGPPGADLQAKMTQYLRDTIAQEWPAMEKGHASRVATRALDAVYTAVLAFDPPDRHGSAVFAEVLRQLDLLAQTRRMRLVMAEGNVPTVLWIVLFGGAVVTIAFTFFFGTENLRAQTMMTGLLSVLIFSGLLVIVAIDYPFAGSLKVEPDALARVLEDFYNSGGGHERADPRPTQPE